MGTVRNVVIAGCGGITAAWMGAIAGFADVNIVGLCDIDAGRIEAFLARWRRDAPALFRGNPATGSDLQSVIKASGADTVFDCTIPAAHRPVVTTALNAGCDVLGEKPMAETMSDAREMIATAGRAGKTYAVIQNRRYESAIQRFRETLASGAIGEITTLHADFFLGAHFEGFRNEMDHVLLVDMAIHTFDQARFLLNADPVSVFAIDWNPAGSWYANGASAVAVFEMSNGAVFTYRGSWSAEGCGTSWESAWRAIGSGGTVLWDGAENISGERPAEAAGFIRKQEPVSPAEARPVMYRSHAGVIREFLDSVAQGRSPQTVCTDNIKSLSMVLGAVKSSETGRKISISEI